MNGLGITTNQNQTTRIWTGIKMNHDERFIIDMEIMRLERVMQQPKSYISYFTVKRTRNTVRKMIESLLELKEK